jgi:hypothetical protein
MLDITMTNHQPWCAGGHRCGLGEHRAEPVTVDLPGVGRLVLTRVLGADGRQYAEVRATAALPAEDGWARVRLMELLRRLPEALRGAR